MIFHSFLFFFRHIFENFEIPRIRQLTAAQKPTPPWTDKTPAVVEVEMDDVSSVIFHEIHEDFTRKKFFAIDDLMGLKMAI